MDKQLGNEYPPGPKRRAFLSDNCDKIEEKGYMKPFDNEKMQSLKDELAEKSIKIGDTEARKKAVNVEFSAELKPLKERSAEITRNLKERAEYVEEECYKFVDTEAKEVGYYNQDGVLIESRPAHPGELQGTIYQLGRKTGTDD